MNTILEEIRKRIKAASDNTDEAGPYDEFESGQGVGLATALQIIDEVVKDHPVHSDIQEVAEITHDEGMKLVDEYIHYLATGLKEGWKRPIGPKWMMEFAKKRFIAGAQYDRERLMKDAVEIEVSNVGILEMGKGTLRDRGIQAGDTIQVIIIKKEK